MPPTEAKDDFFENGKPVHKTASSLCFSMCWVSPSAFERVTSSERLDSLLASFHSIWKAIGLKKDSDDSMLYFKSFTDNVVLAHPGFSNDLESEFDSYCGRYVSTSSTWREGFLFVEAYRWGHSLWTTLLSMVPHS